MRTSVLPPTPAAMRRAAAIIRDGGLAAFPTETVYGLGANALNAAAVAGIFVAKERPPDNPLIVHVAHAEDARALWEDIPGRARVLMDRLWPGPLTIVLPRKKNTVPDIVTAGLDTVAVRCPAHPVALALLLAAKLPIAAPSANRSGRPSPTEAAHVMHDMKGRVPLILDGGPCGMGLESTVIDLTGAPVILRPGGVTREVLKEALGEPVAVARGVSQPLGEGERPRSPGMAHAHYSPDAEMWVFRARDLDKAIALYDGSPEKRPVFLVPEGTDGSLGGRDAFSLGGDGEQAASRLFGLLRRCELEGRGLILAQAVDNEGIGLAIMNRMLRAGGFRVIGA